jgi:DNA repair exonuclease SbcCD ATPase subunit
VRSSIVSDSILEQLSASTPSWAKISAEEKKSLLEKAKSFIKGQEATTYFGSQGDLIRLSLQSTNNGLLLHRDDYGLARSVKRREDSDYYSSSSSSSSPQNKEINHESEDGTKVRVKATLEESDAYFAPVMAGEGFIVLQVLPEPSPALGIPFYIVIRQVKEEGKTKEGLLLATVAVKQEKKEPLVLGTEKWEASSIAATKLPFHPLFPSPAQKPTQFTPEPSWLSLMPIPFLRRTSLEAHSEEQKKALQDLHTDLSRSETDPKGIADRYQRLSQDVKREQALPHEIDLREKKINDLKETELQIEKQDEIKQVQKRIEEMKAKHSEALSRQNYILSIIKELSLKERELEKLKPLIQEHNYKVAALEDRLDYLRKRFDLKEVVERFFKPVYINHQELELPIDYNLGGFKYIKDDPDGSCSFIREAQDYFKKGYFDKAKESLNLKRKKTTERIKEIGDDYYLFNSEKVKDLEKARPATGIFANPSVIPSDYTFVNKLT